MTLTHEPFPLTHKEVYLMSAIKNEHAASHAQNNAHIHTHAHTHVHADGTAHSHSHAAASSPEEALALLKYMLDHNRHHAEELHELAHCFDDVSADLIHDAVVRLGDSNALLEQALSLLNNQ